MLQPKYFVYCGYCHLKTLDPSSPSSAGLKLEVIYAPCHKSTVTGSLLFELFFTFTAMMPLVH